MAIRKNWCCHINLIITWEVHSSCTIEERTTITRLQGVSVLFKLFWLKAWSFQNPRDYISKFMTCRSCWSSPRIRTVFSSLRFRLRFVSFTHLKEDILVHRFFSSFQALNKNFKHLNVCKLNVQTFNPAKESLAINENCFGALESSPSFHAFSIVSKSLTASFSATSGDGGQVFFSREKIFGAPQLYKRLEWNNGLMAMVGIDLLGVHLVSHWIHVRPSQLYHPKKQQKTS